MESPSTTIITDLEAEQNLISTFVSGHYNEFVLQCSDVLEPDDFVDKWCGDVWRVLKALADERTLGDFTNIASKAKQMGLYNVDTRSLMLSATEGTRSFPLEIATYLADLSTRRHLLDTLVKQIGQTQEITIPIETVLGELKGAIDNTASKSMNDVSNSDVCKTTITNWEKRIKGETEQGLLTGFHYIDTRGGLQLSDLNIIAGRTSHGKTSLAIAIALAVAEQGNPVAIYSLEMSFEQLFTRMTAIRSGISASRLQYTKLDQPTFETAFRTASQIGDLPIFYEGTRTSNIRQIEVAIRRMKLNRDIKLAVVDYAQLLTNPQARDKRDIVGGAADSLKRLAVELNVCIILISQLRRASQSENPVPSIAQLKESGNLENAADNIYLVYRPELHQLNYPDLSEQWSRYDPKGTALIINGKSRNHSIGEFLLGFDGERTCFYELSTPPLLPVNADDADQRIESKQYKPPF